MASPTYPLSFTTGGGAPTALPVPDIPSYLNRLEALMVALFGIDDGTTLAAALLPIDSSGRLTITRVIPADPGSGKAIGDVMTGTAGATLAIGDWVYFDTSTSKWKKTNGSGASTCGDVMVGMCIQAAAADGSATTVLRRGTYHFASITITAGPLYVHPTVAGSAATSAPSSSGNIIRFLGYGLSTTVVYVDPSQDWFTV